MANYANILAEITAAIFSNDNEEITGDVLQAVLLDMVASLGSDYQLKGIATVDTDPGTPDQKVAYIAGPGTYPNFGNAVISDGWLGLLKFSGTWTQETVQVGKTYDQEIQDLKDAIGDDGGTVTVTTTWESGTLALGEERPSTTRIRTSLYLFLGNYETLSISAAGGYSFAVFAYNTPTEAGYDSSTSWVTSWNVASSQKYIRIVARKSDDSTVDTSIAQYITMTADKQPSGLVAQVMDLADDLDGKVTGIGSLEVDDDGYTRYVTQVVTRPINDKFVSMMSVTAQGADSPQNPRVNNLGNCATPTVDITDLTITPISDNVIFKVAYYSSSGGYQSQTPYMGRVSGTYVDPANVVTSYTVNPGKVRIVVANTDLQTGSRDKSVALAKVSFSGADATYTVGGAGDLFQNIERQPYFASTDIRTYVPVVKENGIWKAVFNPHDHEIENTHTAFVSPTGSDSNNGLTPLTPKLTIDAATLIAGTVVLLPGTYVAGTHFTAGMGLAEMNLIALGDVTVDANGGLPLNVTGNFYAEGIKFVNGSDGSLKVNIGDTSSVCCLNGCEFNGAVGSSFGGLYALGGNIYVYRCKASNNIKDGFNYHKTSGNVVPHVTEIECEAYNNGNADSYNSNNGSTAHDGIKIIRVACRYGYCRGGVLADVNAGTESYNFGIVSVGTSLVQSSSDDPQYMASVFCGSSCLMVLYDCTLTGSKYAISCVNTGSRVISNKRYSSTYADGGIIEYI